MPDYCFQAALPQLTAALVFSAKDLFAKHLILLWICHSKDMRLDGFCPGSAKSWLLPRPSWLHRTALPTGLTSLMCKIKQPQWDNQDVCIPKTTAAGHQGCPASVNLEINTEAAEIPVVDRSPDAMTHKDLWKFVVSWHCPQKKFCRLSCGEGYESPATSSTTSITPFKL